MTHHLAQINVAKMIGVNIDDPIMKEFVDNLDRVNALAESSEGFIWRLKDDSNNASGFNPYNDEQIIINISVWKDIESLENFTYKTFHTDFLKRRKEWFARYGKAHFALWWIREGTIPTIEESVKRLAYLQENGPTEWAFDFRSRFPKPEFVNAQKLLTVVKNNEELKSKIKRAITDSGFPLEMELYNYLDSRNWSNSMNVGYEDFQTTKRREIDIVSHKSINGLNINLIIEAKKSKNKQLVLYTPHESRNNEFIFFNRIGHSPRISIENETIQICRNILDQLGKLPILNDKIPLSSSLIITAGNKVAQGNDSFFASLNGIIMKNLITQVDQSNEMSIMNIYLNVLIYDGPIFRLTRSDTEPFNLDEIEYGQLLYDHKLTVSSEFSTNRTEILKAIEMNGNQRVIEIMSPKYFEGYLDNIEKGLEKLEINKLQEWGNSTDYLMRLIFG